MADTYYTIYSGFYDSVSKDRLYSADDMNRPYKSIISEGIFSIDDDFAVVPSSGMVIQMKAGVALLGERWIDASATLITVPDNGGQQSRTDSVILQINNESDVRAGRIVYRTGVADGSGEYPGIIIGNDNIHELILATVTVAAGATSIAAANITSKRGTIQCPYAKFIVGDAQIEESVESVLADHPEWTTTVQDGSITMAKLNSALASIINGHTTQIAELNNALDVIKDSQLYDIPQDISTLETDEGCYYQWWDGARKELSLTNAVKLADLHLFDVVTVHSDNAQTLVFFDANGNYVKGYNNGTTPSFSTHSYVVDDPTISYAWVNVTISTQAQYTLTLSTMFYDAYENDKRVYNSVYKESTLFDAVLIDNNVTLPNYGWITSDGVIHPQQVSGSWQYSDKVDSYEGQLVEYYCYGQQGVANVIFFSSTDVVLGYVTYVPTGSEIVGIVQGTTYAPSGTAYLRACSFLPSLSDWYVTAKSKTNLPYTLNALANRTAQRPWEGKTINCLGDSITYGAGLSSPTTQRWSTILASLSGATVNNYGVSGSKVSDISGDSVPSFIDRYQSMVDADLVIVFGGTNDYWHNATDIGTMGSTDVSTFYGALSTIFDYLVKKSPLTQVIFVFPYQQKFGDSNSRVNNGHGTLEDFRNASKVMCEYYSIPMLDFFSKSGFDVIDSSVQFSALTNDGVHPNVAGHNYIARRINNFINEIEPLIE